MPSFHAALFDLDGTLVDSLPGIAAALNTALAEHGHDGHPEERVRTFIGNGSRMLCHQALPEGDREVATDPVHASFLEHYQEAWREGTELYPGIRALLAELSGQLPLAILSNKPHPFTVEMVDHLFPDQFSIVLGHREGEPRKPDPAGALEIAESLGVPAEATAFIGDSTVDHETAVRAGMQSVLVSWGYHPRGRLTATSAPLLDSPEELQRRLQGPRREE